MLSSASSHPLQQKNSMNQRWDIIVEMTNNMCALAVQDCWDQLIELEAQRNSLLKQYLHDYDVSEGVSLAALEMNIESLMTIDKKLLDAVTERKNETAAQLQGIQSGKRAISDYIKNKL